LILLRERFRYGKFVQASEKKGTCMLAKHDAIATIAVTDVESILAIVGK
jgi:hypothetical protein